MQNSYDQLIYNSYPRPETHPAHLATIAELLGLTAPALKAMRILELGAGTGGNLIPLAERFPESYFLGIDLSAKQVAFGQKQITALGLNNIELREQSILDFPEDAGAFDYIICHGVFSWVATEVQDKILEIFSKHLTTEGLGYLSYNTLPGWRINGAAREMMQYHVSEIETPEEQVQQAKALVQFLANSQVLPDSPYAQFLQQLSAELKDVPPYYLFHEYLEAENQAFYFHEFISKLDATQLAYVGDAHFALMSLVDLPEVTQQILTGLDDRLKLEQYLDFIRNRKLRESIICHAGREIQSPVSLGRIKQLYCSADLTMVESLFTEEVTVFNSENGGELSTANPVTIAALKTLSAIWPEQLRLDLLTQKAVAEVAIFIPSAELPALTGQFQEEMFYYYSGNLLDFRSTEFLATRQIDGSPKATPLARYQAVRQGNVTSLRHKSVNLESITRQILTLLDGTRDRTAILAELIKLRAKGELFLFAEGKDSVDEEFKSILETIVDRSLVLLAKHSFLLKA